MIRVGIIGLNASGNGWAAEAHAPAVLAVPELELAAVATRSQQSADESAARFGIPIAYGNALALIDDPSIDVVAVVSPVPTHRERIIAALQRGKHVLTEWPVAVGSAQIAELATIATTAAGRTAVNLQSRRAPAVVEASRRIAAGELGRVLSVNARSSTAGFGGQIPQQAVVLEDPDTWMNLVTIQAAHTYDLITTLVGPVETVHSLLDTQYPRLRISDGGHFDRRLPDHVLIHGRATHGTVSAEITGGAPAGEAELWLKVVGTDHTLELHGEADRGFQAAPISLAWDGELVIMSHSPLDDLPTSVVNVAHVYAAFAADITNGTTTAPSFSDAAILAEHTDATLAHL